MTNYLKQRMERLIELYHEVKQEIRLQDKHLYERWKAGGYLVDSDIISMYPSLESIFSTMEDADDDEEDDED